MGPQPAGSLPGKDTFRCVDRDCFNQGTSDTLMLRRRAHVLVLGGLWSGGGRQGLGSDEGLSPGLGYLDSSAFRISPQT